MNDDGLDCFIYRSTKPCGPRMVAFDIFQDLERPRQLNLTTFGLVACASSTKISNGPTNFDVSLRATTFKLRFLVESNTSSLVLKTSASRLDPVFSFSYFCFARSMVSRVCVIVANITSASSSAAGTSKFDLPRLAVTRGSRAKFAKNGVSPVALRKSCYPIHVHHIPWRLRYR